MTPKDPADKPGLASYQGLTLARLGRTFEELIELFRATS